jgi:hypothetical protein
MSIPISRYAIVRAFLAGLWLLLRGLASAASGSEGDRVQVAAYYFPNWGPVATSEWGLIQAAQPQFEGHRQPKVPAWGYENEKAPNNDRLRFAIMWCNHDVGPAKGAVTPATFDALTSYVVDSYFRHPSAWKIDGKPYFSIYELRTFLETFGNDLDAAAAALDRFREKSKAAGFPGVHLNAVVWGLPRQSADDVIRRLGFDSTTSYVWIHHKVLPDFPATDYSKAAEGYFSAVKNGGGHNGLDRPAASLPVPYHPNVSMGWDSSPRCRNAPDWASRRDYPFGAVIVNNTPAAFRGALERAKPIAAANPPGHRIITLNSWNEWGEGSYLEPDTTTGLGYLEAVRDVFGP